MKRIAVILGVAIVMAITALVSSGSAAASSVGTGPVPCKAGVVDFSAYKDAFKGLQIRCNGPSGGIMYRFSDDGWWMS